jgi:hypothetical protein
MAAASDRSDACDLRARAPALNRNPFLTLSGKKRGAEGADCRKSEQVFENEPVSGKRIDSA